MLFLILAIVIAVIVFIVLAKKGVFREPATCQHCGKTLKGTEQKWFEYGDSSFCLCEECADKIHPLIYNYAKWNWSYKDYTDYLAWDEATKEERAQFQPDVIYGDVCTMSVDSERGLFCFNGTKSGMVFRFSDLTDYELNFKPEEVKEGFFGDRIKGNEFAMVELAAPRATLEEILGIGVDLPARKKGFISSKYEYEFSNEFMELIQAFSICVYIEANRRNSVNQPTATDIGEVQKALALFMFDSIDEVTQDSLKKQRNTLIKAFHPDNAEANEAYSQKINAAYDLLSGMVNK